MNIVGMDGLSVMSILQNVGLSEGILLKLARCGPCLFLCVYVWIGGHSRPLCSCVPLYALARPVLLVRAWT